MNNRAFSSMGTGISSLLTVMAVLLLTSFAVLSLVSSNSDMTLSDKAAEAVAQYYQADSLAEEWRAQLDAALKEGQQGGVAAALQSAGIETRQEGAELVAFSQFPINEKKNLVVEVAISPDGQEANIIKWSSVPVYQEAQ